MLKKEFKKIIENELVPFFNDQGYKKINFLGMIIAFFKDNKHTVFRIDTDDLKYNGFELRYSFNFGLNLVSSILKNIDKQVPLQKGLYSYYGTYLSISPGLILDPLNPGRAYKEVFEETDSIKMLNELKQFYVEKFIPFYEKYSDINYLDSLINNPVDFWDDADPRFRFPTMPYFHIIRLIYARLANSPNYEMIVEKNFDAYEKVWADMGGVFDRNNDKEFPQVFAAKYLRVLSDAQIEKLINNGI